MQQTMPCNYPQGCGSNFPSIYAYVTPSMNGQMCMPMQSPCSPCFPYSCQSPFNNCSPPSCRAPTIYLTLPPQTVEEQPNDERLPAPVQAAPVSQPTRVAQLAKTSHLTSTTDFHSAPTDLDRNASSVPGTPQNRNVMDMPKQHIEDFSDEKLAFWKFDVEMREAEVKAIYKEAFTNKLKPLYPLLQTTLAQKVTFLESARAIRRQIDDIKKVESEQEKVRLNKKVESMIADLLVFFNKMRDKENELRELKDKLLYGEHPFSPDLYLNAEPLSPSELFTTQNVQDLENIWANQNEYLKICTDQVRTNDQEVLQYFYENINTAIGYIFILFDSGQSLKDRLKNAASEDEKAAIENSLRATKKDILYFFDNIKEQQKGIAMLLAMVERIDIVDELLENQQ